MTRERGREEIHLSTLSPAEIKVLARIAIPTPINEDVPSICDLGGAKREGTARSFLSFRSSHHSS